MRKLILLVCFAGLFVLIMPANAQRGTFNPDRELQTATQIIPTQSELDKILDVVGDQLQDYKSTLSSLTISGDFTPGTIVIPITNNTFDALAGLSHSLLTSLPSGTVDESLIDQIKLLEAQLEALRDLRMQSSTAFENFDQKTNELYNLLSTVLKAINEMRSNTTRIIR